VALYAIYKVGVAFVTAGGGPLLSLIDLHFFDVGLFASLIGSGVAAGLVGALLAFGAVTNVER